ncbi:MAG: LytR C-terminal domain-containing protein [Acidimicrobiales bacterium]|nr:LytR C-terminal domain-containing protein [Acidimicrobiales bacterium]MCB9395820.1 LytR C-terminal domain-containing protein [Acidimicrobiaceae bacterium]
MSSDQPRRGRDTAMSAGSPMGSTAAIVIALVAVVAGFLILRQIRSDDDGGTTSTPDATQTTVSLDSTPASTVTPVSTLPSETTTTQFVPTVDGAVVVVANASTVNGAAGVLTTALQGQGFSTAGATNATQKQDLTTILYDATNTGALPVAQSLAVLLGNPVVQEVSTPAPIEGGVLPEGASVIVMLGSDKANKTLEQMGAPTTTVAGVVTTLPAVGGETTTTG